MVMPPRGGGVTKFLKLVESRGFARSPLRCENADLWHGQRDALLRRLLDVGDAEFREGQPIRNAPGRPCHRGQYPTSTARQVRDQVAWVDADRGRDTNVGKL